MSKRRKERKKKNRQKLIATVLAVVAGISLLTAFIVYSVFIKKQPTATFFPEDSVFYSRFDLSPSLTQGRNFVELSQNFEDPEIFVDFVIDFVFGNIDRDQFNLETEDLLGWIGGEVAIGNIPISDFQTSSVMVVDVKNHEKVEEFLDVLNEQLRARGDAINEESFREERIVNVTGRRDISYALTKDFLLVANGDSGVKKMIDVSLGTEKSLQTSEDFLSVKKALNGDGEMVFFYYDLLEFAATVIDNLDFGGEALFERLGYGATLPSGFVLVPERNGFKTRILAHEGSSGEENFKESLTEHVPHDLVFYLEGNDFSAFLEGLLVGDVQTEEEYSAQAEGIKRAIELQYGFNLDTDLFPLVKEQYALTLLRGSDEGKMNLAFLFELENPKEAEEKLSKLEEITLEGAKQLSDDIEGRKFTDHVHDGESYRRLNLPESLQFDINVKIINDRLVIATTEEAMKVYIELEESGKRLKDDALFKQSVASVDVGKSKQLIYLEPQAGLKLVDELTPFDYGFVDQNLRLLESLTLKNHNTRDGVILEGFLRVKEK